MVEGTGGPQERGWILRVMLWLGLVFRRECCVWFTHTFVFV